MVDRCDNINKEKQKLLFICTSNLDRSPCAEDLFKNSKEYEAKSAGFSPAEGSTKLSKQAIAWADIIFVMDERNEGHKTRLLREFPEAEEKEIIILNIPNILCRNDPELKEILKIRLEKEDFEF